VKLTRAEFERRYANGTLKLALIGMSNIGKSYSGMRLATRYDFTLIEVDKLIREELGQGSMDDFAKWQGQPYSQGYAEREAKSIALENQATQRAMQAEGRNPLLDTTGSVIYTSDNVLAALKDSHYIVHIKAAKDAVHRLKTQYFKSPKPLIWAGHYQQIDGKTKRQSILECYPKLLKSRVKSYAELADHTVSSADILNPDMTTEKLFDLIKPAKAV
jgi:shikimate kinase